MARSLAAGQIRKRRTMPAMPNPKPLGGDDQQHLKAPAEVLTVEDLLGEEHIRSICNTTLDGYVRHHDDDGVFLVIKRPGVKIPLEPKGIELVIR